jgi:hypothetical protein
VFGASVGRRRLAVFLGLGILTLATAGATASETPSKVPRPRADLTPGAAEPAVTQENLQQTICVSGYTKRLPKVPAEAKQSVFTAYNIKKDKRDDYVIDQLIPLGLGGSNDVQNLWPVPKRGTNNVGAKDKVERKLRKLVCAGQLSLADAQQGIATDWYAARKTVGTTTTTTTTIPPPAVYDGSGDDVIEITKPASGPAIVHARYTGGSNFVVEALDANNEQTALLVNEIGAYEGTVALDFEDTDSSRLQITASGPWHIEVQDPRVAQRFDASVQGHGDNVLIYTGKTGIAAINHSGQSNFVVTQITRTDSELLVNEIGAYSGRVPWAAGTAFVIVQADGDWSIAVT